MERGSTSGEGFGIEYGGPFVGESKLEIIADLESNSSPLVSQPQKMDRSMSGAARAFQGLKFISKNNVGELGWAQVKARFLKLADNGRLPKSCFGQCLGMNEDSIGFANELFAALARRNSSISVCCSIDIDELRKFWKLMTDDSFDARLQVFFDMVDKNGDGRINKEEVQEIIALSAGANKLSKIQIRAGDYASLIMEQLDQDKVGYIEIEKLKWVLLDCIAIPSKKEDEITDISILSGDREARQLISEKLGEKLAPLNEANPIKMKGYPKQVAYFVEENWRRIWAVGLWVGICAGLFTWKFIQYKNRAAFQVMGYCLSTAKGAAETLKFNMALILLPVSRHTITFIRSTTKLGVLIPFDDNINFHKGIAFGIAMGVGVHAVAHLACDFPRLLHATDEEYRPLAQFFGKERPNNYWWFVKGTEVWTGLVMVLLMALTYTLAQPLFRRNKLKLPKPLNRLSGFNAFWYTHHLFVIVYILFIVHGYYVYFYNKWYKKTTWMYLAVPILLYACERLIRVFRYGYKSVKILEVVKHPGNVVALRMSIPRGFKYSSGQYIYIKCSAIAPLEWHPFSLTSAPGDDYLSVHVRTAGDWTGEFYTIFSKFSGSPSINNENNDQGDGIISQHKEMPRLVIDGAYGAPAQDYKEYEVILLIGLGIGATPLISIIRDMLNNMKHQKENRDGVESGVKRNKRRPFNTKHAYFHWSTREEGSFEWFHRVMEEVAETDSEGVIELHNYCTSVYEEGDARSAFITMLQCLHLAKNGVDILSNTRVKTQFARPKWRKAFEDIAAKHHNQNIGVFYCGGALDLVEELKSLSLEFSRDKTTKFHFHKENF